MPPPPPSEPPEPPPPPPPIAPSPPFSPFCHMQMDLVLVLDESAEMASYAGQVADFARGVINQFHLSLTDAQIGMVGFSGTAHTLAQL
eukprot:1181739-Prymnesium_polylepis.1